VCAQTAAAQDSLSNSESELKRFEVDWGADDSTRVNAVTSEVELFGNAFVAMDDIRLEAYRIVYSSHKRIKRVPTGYGIPWAIGLAGPS
jgi:hypothetical protein